MAHEGLWEQLVELDEQETAQRAQCKYIKNPERYVITLLNADYVVRLADRQIFSVRQESEPTSAEFLEQLSILAYLINAKDVPLANKLVRAETLPAGQFSSGACMVFPRKSLKKRSVGAPTNCSTLLSGLVEKGVASVMLQSSCTYCRAFR